MLVDLIQTLLAYYWSGGNECSHLTRTLQPENIGLVFNSNHLLALIGVDSILCKFFKGIGPKIAIKLRAKEIRK